MMLYKWQGLVSPDFILKMFYQTFMNRIPSTVFLIIKVINIHIPIRSILNGQLIGNL